MTHYVNFTVVLKVVQVTLTQLVNEQEQPCEQLCSKYKQVEKQNAFILFVNMLNLEINFSFHATKTFELLQILSPFLHEYEFIENG